MRGQKVDLIMKKELLLITNLFVSKPRKDDLILIFSCRIIPPNPEYLQFLKYNPSSQNNLAHHQ